MIEAENREDERRKAWKTWDEMFLNTVIYEMLGSEKINFIFKTLEEPGPCSLKENFI